MQPNRLPLLCLCAALMPAAASASELTLRIHRISAGGGNVMVEVLADKAAFDGNGPALASFILPATPPTLTLTTDALPAGEYAIRVMHDRNSNGKLDTNLVGIPKEPWGFSNNASGTFGPPDWAAARFALEDAAVQDINLND